MYKTLFGHEAAVTCVDFVDDDSFVSGDEKGAVLHWLLQGDKVCILLATDRLGW